MIRERENHERRLADDLRARRSVATPIIAVAPEPVNFDFFISHASEDKDAIVRDLAAELTDLGAKVFYDEMTLKVGDSLRRSIDRGLANSRFGVVVLSEHFFRKEWTQKELDGLTARWRSKASRAFSRSGTRFRRTKSAGSARRWPTSSRSTLP